MKFLDPIAHVSRQYDATYKLTTPPEVGDIIVFTHGDTRYVMRIIKKINRDDGRTHYVMRPPNADPDPYATCDEELSGSWPNPPEGRIWRWTYLPEDYPVSVKTGDIYPSQEEIRQVKEKNHNHEQARFSFEFMCPACGEVVTERQHRETFDVNLVVENGPPVTFHVRQKCWVIGGQYKKALAELDMKFQQAVDDLLSFEIGEG